MKDTLIAFLDISKVLILLTNKIMEALEKKKYNKNLITRIKNIFSNCVNRERVEYKKSKWNELDKTEYYLHFYLILSLDEVLKAMKNKDTEDNYIFLAFANDIQSALLGCT